MPTSGGGGSGSAGGSGGGFGGGVPGHLQNVDDYNGMNHRYYGYGGRGPRKAPDPKKGARGILIFILIFIVLGVISFFDSALDSDLISDENGGFLSSLFGDDDDNSELIELKKDKLDESLCNATGEYIYNTVPNYVILSEPEIKEAFGNFYEETGVEPCIYVIGEVIHDLEDFAYDKYLELFDDEGHLLIVLFVDGDRYVYELTVGDDAMNYIFDGDGLEALRSNLNNMGVYVDELNSQYDYSRAVCTALTASIKDIMTTYDYAPASTEPNEPDDFDDEPESEPTEPSGENNAEPNSGSSKISLYIFVGLLIAVVAAFAVFGIFQAAAKRKASLVDDYSSDRTDTDHSLDDYDEQFKKLESKYDDFYDK